MKIRHLPCLALILLGGHGLAQAATERPPIVYGKDVSERPGESRPYIVDNVPYYPYPHAEGFEEEGVASWYGPNFHGKLASAGEIYDMNQPTAAHKLLPFNTMLLVCNLENGREAMVRVNDRGPFVKNRILDLSRAAAEQLGVVCKGTAKVRITAMGATETRVDRNNRTHRCFKPHPDLYSGEFYVQVGAFVKPDNAQKLAGSLTAKKHKVMIQRYITEKRTFYRVQVFAGTRLETARKLEARLLRSGFPEAFVVAK